MICKTYLTRRVTAPATTGDATLVPDRDRQPPLRKRTVNERIFYIHQKRFLVMCYMKLKLMWKIAIC